MERKKDWINVHESITFRDLSPVPHFQKDKAACFTSIGRLDLPLCVEKAELGLWLLFLGVVQPETTNNAGRWTQPFLAAKHGKKCQKANKESNKNTKRIETCNITPEYGETCIILRIEK